MTKLSDFDPTTESWDYAALERQAQALRSQAMADALISLGRLIARAASALVHLGSAGRAAHG